MAEAIYMGRRTDIRLAGTPNRHVLAEPPVASHLLVQPWRPESPGGTGDPVLYDED